MTDPRQGRPRGSRSARDMVLSMLPLVAVALALAGFAGMCSVSPGGPTTDPRTVPSVDAAAELDRAAGAVAFPLREPVLPRGWRPTSASVDRVGPVQAVRVGWLTPSHDYLRLSQSAAVESELVAFETRQQVAATGAVQAAGRTWVRYPSVRDELAWVTDLGDVRLLITGNAAESEFRTLARAVLPGRVLEG
ncbi:MAG: DUF4245 domain-containing protein [Pseudonocardiaceae bacterium]